MDTPTQFNELDHPQHYNSLGAECMACGHPIACWDVNQHFNGNLAATIKYVWRAGLKDGDPIKDLEKAIRYLKREIMLLNREIRKRASANS